MNRLEPKYRGGNIREIQIHHLSLSVFISSSFCDPDVLTAFVDWPTPHAPPPLVLATPKINLVKTGDVRTHRHGNRAQQFWSVDSTPHCDGIQSGFKKSFQHCIALLKCVCVCVEGGRADLASWPRILPLHRPSAAPDQDALVSASCCENDRAKQRFCSPVFSKRGRTTEEADILPGEHVCRDRL